MNKLFSFFAFLSLVITSKNTFSMKEPQSWALLCENAKNIANEKKAFDLKNQNEKAKVQQFLFFASCLRIDKLFPTDHFKEFFSHNNHITYENCIEIMKDYNAQYKNKENVIKKFNIKYLKANLKLIYLELYGSLSPNNPQAFWGYNKDYPNFSWRTFATEKHHYGKIHRLYAFFATLATIYGGIALTGISGIYLLNKYADKIFHPDLIAYKTKLLHKLQSKLPALPWQKRAQQSVQKLTNHVAHLQ